MPARISSSDTASIAPPLRRARSSAYGPSAGLPMASDLAIVSGAPACRRRGRPRRRWPPASSPRLRAVHHGRVAARQAEVQELLKPLAIFVYSDPEAIGATTRSGTSQPSCSATS
jgi:hypothetical protein